MNYYSDEVFSQPSDRIIASAAQNGMTSILLSYLQVTCQKDSHSERSNSLLADIYRSLGCHINACFLQSRYIRKERCEREQTWCRGIEFGLMIDGRIGHKSETVYYQPEEDLWVERDLLLDHLRNNRNAVTAWFKLVGQYVALEELLMAIWTLIQIKLNAPMDTVINSSLCDELTFIKACRECPSIWSIVADDQFHCRMQQIFQQRNHPTEVANSIQETFSAYLCISLDENDLLRSFSWPNSKESRRTV